MDLEKEFEVKSKLGKLISVTKDYWKIITEIKHPIIKGKQNLVMKTLANPAIIKRSSKDIDVYLYYRQVEERFICTVARHENGTGFLITAYFTDRIKEGEIIWTK